MSEYRQLLDKYTLGKEGHFAMIGSSNDLLARFLLSRLESPYDKLFIFENYEPNKRLEKLNAIIYPGTFPEFLGDFKKHLHQEFSFVYIDLNLKDKYKNAFMIREALEKVFPYVRQGGLILINNYSDPTSYYVDSVSDSIKGSIDWFVNSRENQIDTIYYRNMIGIIKKNRE